MRIAAQQSLLPGATLTEKFRNAKAFGYDGVEVTAWGFAGSLADHRDEIAAASREAGVPVSSLCTSGEDDFVHPDPKERKKRLAGMVACLKLAEALGAAGVVGLPIRPPLRLPDLSPVADERALVTQVAAAQLKAALGRTADGKAAFFLEPLNRYEANYLKTLHHAADLIDAAGGGPRLKIVADLFHMNIEEADIPAALRAAGDRVGHVHLADSNRLLPGHGHTDFVAAFRALGDVGFAGWMALECSVPGDPNETLPECARFLRRCWEAAGQPV